MSETAPSIAQHYDWQPTEAYCKQLGMPVDYAGLKMADEEANYHGLSQTQFDASLRLHAWRVKTLFDPKSYSFLGRLALAAYFLFGLGAKR